MIETLFAAAVIALAPVDVYAHEVGDYNQNGIVEEDESGWSCADMGNRVCGPDNPAGVPAGLYDQGGVLIDPWPVA